ncbi:MAG: GNAT family N-acetyltransferase [Roseburia sp.]|nr:GNAT family N-acetyltransferase [Roseburia sp.]MDD6217465.1 GNAT family protein [Roseburia sp.]MDY5881859.1 GNAT family protein [Roseburia sp.]
MDFCYETERLVLRILNTNEAKKVLDFQLRDRELFEKYEPDRPDSFYTIRHQEALLKCEYKLALSLSTVRFYVFLKEDPTTIIGTVCFHNILRNVYACTEVGYKFSSAYQHHGYAREALEKGISIMFTDLGLHRINARVALDNTPSIHLLESLSFRYEGIECDSIFLHGEWVDHMRYGLIRPADDTNTQND